MSIITNPRQLQCAALLVHFGASPSGAAGLTGNFCRESGPTLPTAFRREHLDHGSNGLAQWRLSRLDAYQDFVQDKHPEIDNDDDFWPWYGRLDYQCEFVMHELRTDYPRLFEKIAAGGDVAALAADVCWQYERPNKALSGIADRIAYAKAIAAEMTRTAHVDLPSTLVQTAQMHEQQAQAGAIATGGAAVSGVALAGYHLVPHMPEWQIVLACIVLVTLTIGIIITVTHSAQAAQVRSAIPNADPTAPRGGHKNPIDKPQTAQMPTAATDATHESDAEMRKRHASANEKKATQGEQAAINEAMGGDKAVKPSTPAADDPSKRDVPTSGMKMSVGTSDATKQ